MSLDELYERLQSLLLNVSDIDRFLIELSQLATGVVSAPADAVPDAPDAPDLGLVSCGIMMRYDGQLLTAGSSDARAEGLDETQYRAGAGPCLQSMNTGQVVESPDTSQETRWPEYLPVALKFGMRCSLSLPLRVGADTFGAMNLYGFDRPNLFGALERRQLELFAAQAAGTLQIATRQSKDTTLLRRMEEALRSRTTIDQALGIIMGQQRCTAEEAFALLRRESQNSRRRLRDLAADLIVRTSGHPPDPGRPFDI